MVDWNKHCSAEQGSYGSARKHDVGKEWETRARNCSPLWNIPNAGVVPHFDASPPHCVLLGCCCQQRTSSQSCLNENVPGAESAADMAVHVTLPHHAGAEAG